MFIYILKKTTKLKANAKSSIAGENNVKSPLKKKNRKKSNREKDASKKKKFKENFYNCGKFDHMSSVFWAPKKDKKKKEQENKNKIEDNLCAMILRYYLVGNAKEWRIYLSSTHHVHFKQRTVFILYFFKTRWDHFYGKFSNKKEGYGKLGLKMTSRKMVILNKVLHIPEIQKNLVLITLLVRIIWSVFLYKIKL